MSRIGKKYIKVPENVSILKVNKDIMIMGVKGTLFRKLPSFIFLDVDHEKKIIRLEKALEIKSLNRFYGLFRTIINNMCLGVSIGFQKTLQLKGVGYRALLEKGVLVLNTGYSAPSRLRVPPSLKVTIDSPTFIRVSGIEKDLVGDFSAKIRAVRPPEPYKGKGISYQGEYIKRKVGKIIKK